MKHYFDCINYNVIYYIKFCMIQDNLFYDSSIIYFDNFIVYLVINLLNNGKYKNLIFVANKW